MIRLYIHDKCMEQLFQLPRATQKKVLEFQKKFRENPKAPAIHLEPINTFKDKQLRTARIGDDYRAIIGAPKTGEDYYLLWVDHHDEAMDWAANKVFQWNDNTNAAQIFETPEIPSSFAKTKTTLDGSPDGLFGKYSNEQLFAIGVPEVALGVIRSIYDMNDLEKAESSLPPDAFENLFYLSDGVSITQLISEIKDGTTGIDQNSSINNRRNFIEVDDKLLEEYLNGELSKWQIFLHPSQRKLVESNFKGPVRVTGGGGTGKTVVALHRLKALTNQLKESSKPVLFTTFTHALTTNLKSIVHSMQVPPSKYKLVNIDALSRELGLQNAILNETTRILDMPGSKKSDDVWEEVLEKNLSIFDTRFLRSEYQNVWLVNNIKSPEEYFRTSRLGRGKPITRKQKMELVSLIVFYEEIKKKNNLMDRGQLFNLLSDFYSNSPEKPYSHVIADEVQDLSNIELRFLRSLVSEKENDMLLVGDPYQKIYSRQINFSSAGINVRGNRSKRLRINYRTTEEIKRFAISLVRGIQYDDFDGSSETMDGYLSLFHGVRPTYDIFKTKQDEVESIMSKIKELQKGRTDYSDMVIACRQKDELKEIKKFLHLQRLPYFDILDQIGQKDGIHLSTFHSLKGLEFKVVFLADVNNRTAPFLPVSFQDMDESEQTEFMQSERALLYVAITRAISQVFISGTGVKSELFLS